MLNQSQGKWEENLSNSLQNVDRSIQDLRKQFSVYQEQISPAAAKPLFSKNKLFPGSYQSPVLPNFESTPKSHARPLPFFTNATQQDISFQTEVPSQSLVMSLLKRIDEQAETISSLSEALSRLQRESALHTEQISALQGNTEKLERKCENCGCNSELDGKFSRLHKELKKELATLKAKGKGTSLSGLSKNVLENKKMCQNEAASLKKNIEDLNMRFGKFDLDLSSSTGNYADISRQNEKIEREISYLQDKQKNLAERIVGVEERSELRTRKTKKRERKNSISGVSKGKDQAIGGKSGLKVKHRKSITPDITDSDLSISHLDSISGDDISGDLNTDDLIRGEFDDTSHSSIQSDFLQSL